MKKNLVLPLVLFTVVCWWASGAKSQESAANSQITGHVFDETGKPVDGAEVFAFATRNGNVSLSSKTDPNGHFAIKAPKGEFVVVAAKEAADYPDCRLRYFLCEKVIVTIDSAGSSSLELHVAKAARVKGILSDGETSDPITTGILRIRRGDDFYNMYQTNITSPFSILLPTDVELTIESVADNYRWWQYRNPVTGDASIKLVSGTETQLIISMHRIEP